MIHYIFYAVYVLLSKPSLRLMSVPQTICQTRDMWNQQPPQNFNNDGSPHFEGQETEQATPDPNRERPVAESPSVQDAKAAQKKLKRLYIILLVIGLGIGGLLAYGIVAALDRLGLTDNSPGIEEIQR